MRRLKLFALSVLMALASNHSAFAYDFCVDGIYYNIISSSALTCEVTNNGKKHSDGFPLGDSYLGEVKIPATVAYNDTEYKVKSISDYAFFRCSGLTSAVIGSNITTIGKVAFAGCYNLASVVFGNSVTTIGDEAFGGCSMTSVSIPNSVTTIGERAFLACSSLKSVTLPNSVTTIGDYAFRCCSALTSVVIPNSVTEIKDYTFSECSTLASVSIPNSVTSIGSSAFYYCSSLTSVMIPTSVTSIGSSAFCYCSNLTSVEIPNSVTTIGNSAFSICTNLTSIEIPNSVTMIGSSAFSICSRLKSVTIGNSVTSIGSSAFSDCNRLESFSGQFASDDHRCLIVNGVLNSFAPAGLTSYEIPNSVTSIGQYAFSGCSSLTSVEIPSTVTTIGNYAFFNCSSLTEIICNRVTPPNIDSSCLYNVPVSTCVLKVPNESVELYQTADGWEKFTNIQGFVTSVTLVDATPYAQATDEENVSVTYTRNFTNAAWQALYVPFDMSYEEWSPYGEVAEISGVHMYDTDDDGEIDRSTVEFKRIRNAEAALKPNTPYVFLPKKTGEVTFECENKTLKAAESGSVWCATTRQKYTLTGIYQPTEMNGRYALTASGIFMRGTSASPNLSPFRFYLTIEDVDNGYGDSSSQTSNAPRIVDIMIDGETVTNIDPELFCPADGAVYDLSGRKLNGAPQKGIYIKNGRKFIK